MLLADIGNTYFHIYNGKEVEHLSYDDAIEKYANKEMCYITVKHTLGEKIEHIKSWQNISSSMGIEGEYETMGVDRKALCLSHEHGIFVDAGSAITVDIVEAGMYIGGFILPGIKAYLESYKAISSVLDVRLEENLSLTTLPLTTKEQISYGIIASIKSLIEKHSGGKKLYLTGGDGKFLSTFFDDVIYDDTLVFQGILKTIKDKKIC
ncbi:MAG: type III pantothenate kinase [Epsilonproteobacteria bacterium]|nr:type III pantothenate kinase [Campylobacterota bacterium]